MENINILSLFTRIIYLYILLNELILIKGSLVCKTSVLRIFNSCSITAPKLASQGLRNDGCETVSDHSQIILGSCSGLEFSPFSISWQVQHFVDLHVQISWQVQHFVDLHVQIWWQVQHFVDLHVQIAWQVQHFVNLHVQR